MSIVNIGFAEKEGTDTGCHAALNLIQGISASRNINGLGDPETNSG